jgi:hypothetical protein
MLYGFNLATEHIDKLRHNVGREQHDVANL